jgi:hypothetical protein
VFRALAGQRINADTVERFARALAVREETIAGRVA